MSGRLLTVSQYLSGADQVKCIEMFPSTQKEFTYDFQGNVADYTFEADYQTLVVDSMTYDRNTGEPNFTESTVVGYFANAEIDANAFIDTSANTTGIIKLTIPKQRYTGNLIPDARTNVALTIAAFKWTNTTANVTESHRWAIIERYEPDVTPGNPRDEVGFIAL